MIKTYNEQIKIYQDLYKDINDTLDTVIGPDDTTIIYELDQESIDEGRYDYRIDVYSEREAIYELLIVRVRRNGEIYGYVNYFEDYWTIDTALLHNVRDKLTIIEILENGK